MMRIIAEGLTRKDYRWKRIAKIEKAVGKEILSRMERLGLPKEEISFFFPRDISIRSCDVPVNITVELFDFPEMTKEIKDSLAGAVGLSFFLAVRQWRKVATPIQVFTRTIDRKVEGIFFFNQ
jgi:hypothetical protein